MVGSEFAKRLGMNRKRARQEEKRWLIPRKKNRNDEKRRERTMNTNTNTTNYQRD
jgi:hypothetical protein